jgi:serine/threonine protein kinase
MNIEIVIPSTILFVAFNAIDDPSKISLADCESCPEFTRWQRLRMKGIEIDFRRILKFNSGLPELTAYLLDVSSFEEGSVLNECQTYQRRDDGCLIVVKSMNISDCVDREEVEKEIEIQMNLRHPCIAGPIGFVFPANSSASEQLKIGRLFAESVSLAEILSVSPEWWTPTVKVKTVMGILLGLRFAHSLGLIHGHLTADNIFFDADHQVQMADFGFIGFERPDNITRKGIREFSGEDWTPQVDIRAFLSLLELIVMDRVRLPNDVNSEGIIRARVPGFVFEMIDKSRSDSTQELSLDSLIYILKENKFEIVTGVDSAEVLAFVGWVEQWGWEWTGKDM